MRKGIAFLIAGALGAGLAAPAGLAQIPNYGENHYLVYEVAPTGIVFETPIILRDQFEDLYATDLVELDLFANPVDKNSEGFVNDLIHQTWWTIDDFEPPRQLLIENQFELPGTWYVKNGKFLVLPASKGDNPDIPLPESWNHYKCYEEISVDPVPLVFAEPLVLQDQFFTYTVTQLTRIYFCTPCLKEVGAEVFPIENTEAHLAVYRLDPLVTLQNDRWVADQFGVREITIASPKWLVVPSAKGEVITSEANTWGGVKSLYR